MTATNATGFREPGSRAGSAPDDPRPTAFRRPRSELRALLLETGRQILLCEGLGTGAERLTFKRVFDQIQRREGIRVTNASVIGRVWENQADYQADVLALIATDDRWAEVKASVEKLAPIVARADRSTEEGRWRAVAEVCRVGGRTSLDLLVASPTWRAWIGIWSLSGTQPSVSQDASEEAMQRIDDALRQTYEVITSQYEVAYRAMLEALGFRIRKPFTLRQVTVSISAMAEGCALRDRVEGRSIRGIRRPTGPEGKSQEWTLFSVAIEGLVRQFIEPDPEWRPPAS